MDDLKNLDFCGKLIQMTFTQEIWSPIREICSVSERVGKVVQFRQVVKVNHPPPPSLKITRLYYLNIRLGEVATLITLNPSESNYNNKRNKQKL